MRARGFAIVLLVCLGFSGAVGAYAVVARWGTQQVPYYINPANSFMPEADAIAAIQAGANAWSMQSGARILPYYLGRTSGSSVTNNGRNEIFFRTGSNGAYYGETYWWYDANRQLLDADIIFYSTYPFFPGSTGCSSGLYLEDATAHEFGHLLGLGHSEFSGATMYWSMPYCSTQARQLDPDDVSGIEALYPPVGSNTSPAVVVASPTDLASATEGQSFTFSGSASDREDGDLSQRLVWSSSRDGEIGTGPTFQRVLTIGTHTITAQVVDSMGASAESRRTFTVAAPTTEPASGMTLSGRGYKVKGVRKADLTWNGSAAGSIDVFRNGTHVFTVTNLGMVTDSISGKGSGSFVYKVCEASRAICSNQVSIVF